ncbi:TusE/DsrC/DsvC family sulfur relay protein [Desulfobacter sp. UBA2225]|jgi:tRNA 2-thiouridine synthesizing protein E|uniref:TusE/DsrC/DsvC family sulfur relay protein n=1 Tax=Desulfobacter sp. UBA2225 TaxID=1961413 RepID=UPI00257FCB4E|nr:TusE/DsrC/DsvC family sulfur relay protein [Desulfobacter sp. UBA2225]
MVTINKENIAISMDQEGYLTDFESWNEEIACVLAHNEGVSQKCPLNKEKIEILKFLRDYYNKFEAFPIVRAVCKRVGQSKNCQYEEFPDPLVAWKIAGLPKPTPEVLAKIKSNT